MTAHDLLIIAIAAGVGLIAYLVLRVTCGRVLTLVAPSFLRACLLDILALARSFARGRGCLALCALFAADVVLLLASVPVGILSTLITAALLVTRLNRLPLTGEFPSQSSPSNPNPSSASFASSAVKSSVPPAPYVDPWSRPALHIRFPEKKP